jgi:hypothetical protein
MQQAVRQAAFFAKASAYPGPAADSQMQATQKRGKPICREAGAWHLILF